VMTRSVAENESPSPTSEVRRVQRVPQGVA
jgi:hypothetical protein